MKKALILLLLIFLSIIIGGIYGILNDQLTYTISPEYYTRFKFFQFGLAEEGVPIQNPRLLVAFTGWMATWWMGLIIGLILSLIAMPYRTSRQVFKTTMKGLMLVFATTVIMEFAGLLYAYLFLPTQWEDYLITWGVPYETVDVANFVRVGTMHTFAYIGGLLGLIIAAVSILKVKKKSIVRST